MIRCNNDIRKSKKWSEKKEKKGTSKKREGLEKSRGIKWVKKIKKKKMWKEKEKYLHINTKNFEMK